MSGWDILLAVLGISVLVIIHELGHYLAARAFGMRVLRFSVGFGPTLVRYQPKGSATTFQICAIPFLAYVQIAGMSINEKVDSDDPELFNNKGLFARMVTIVAGPLANYLTASLLVLGIGLSGWPEDVPTRPVEVAAVSKGSPAAKAGVRPGDRVLQAGGKKIQSMEDLIAITSPRAGKHTEYVISREGKQRALQITPERSSGRGVIGVVAKTIRTYQPLPFPEALQASVVFPVKLTVAQLQELGKRIQQGSTEGVSGPWGMGKIVAEQVREGPAEYLTILMLLSVALGMFNLLPLPALDGGRLVFLSYELVTRRKPNERFEAVVHTVGLVLLLTLLVFVTIRDVSG